MSEIVDKVLSEAFKSLAASDQARVMDDLRHFGQCIIRTKDDGTAERIAPVDFYQPLLLTDSRP